MTSGASKEANKNVAKDSDASLGTRAQAAKDAAGDKIDESKNSVSCQRASFSSLANHVCRLLPRVTSRRLLTKCLQPALPFELSHTEPQNAIAWYRC